MHVTEGDMMKKAHGIIDCPEEDADDTVRDAYDLLMDETEVRRKNLEDRCQRLKLLRRSYEAGRKHGAKQVRREFQRVIRGNGV